MIQRTSVAPVPIAAVLCVLLAGSASGQGTGLPPSSETQAVVATSSRANPDYTVSRLDVLNITLAEEPGISGKYTVDVDGTLAFPHVGRFKAEGLTVRQVEAEIGRRLLADAYFLEPHLTVTLDQFRGRRVFVFGGVTAPGMYPLGDATTLLEVLVKAGGGNASEAFVIRSPGAIGPVLPADAKAAEVIKVSVREFERDVEAGVLSRNILMRDGYTVFVPRLDRNRVFATGEVKNPGPYSVPEGTTVLQLLSLAGGVTEAASTGRIKILRIENNQKKTIKVGLTDVVLPGDTVVVPQRFF
jgi:polysaccharide export outer membrane protein